MTIRDLREIYVVVEHVIPLPAVSIIHDRIEQAFGRARESMDEALSRGRPFVVSDGRRALIVAQPAQPLMITDHRTGELYAPQEQEFMALLRSVW